MSRTNITGLLVWGREDRTVPLAVSDEVREIALATPTTLGILSAAGGAPDGTAGYIYVDGNQI